MTSPTFIMPTHIVRGRRETEIPLLVEYSVNPADPKDIEIVSIRYDDGREGLCGVSSEEFHDLLDQACIHSGPAFSEWLSDTDNWFEGARAAESYIPAIGEAA